MKRSIPIIGLQYYLVNIVALIVQLAKALATRLISFVGKQIFLPAKEINLEVFYKVNSLL